MLNSIVPNNSMPKITRYMDALSMLLRVDEEKPTPEKNAIKTAANTPKIATYSFCIPFVAVSISLCFCSSSSCLCFKSFSALVTLFRRISIASNVASAFLPTASLPSALEYPIRAKSKLTWSYSFFRLSLMSIFSFVFSSMLTSWYPSLIFDRLINSVSAFSSVSSS